MQLRLFSVFAMALASALPAGDLGPSNTVHFAYIDNSTPASPKLKYASPLPATP